MTISIPPAYADKPINVKVAGSTGNTTDARWKSWRVNNDGSLDLLDANDFRVTQFAAGTWTQVAWGA